ncbi:tubulin-tyrosine ligase family protein [Stylonychia lemnae]|uniref:Tubulin-tyrosine ligase family protein n=1 Tax=Stylonychia lemnae TaxID=5949 RepID=A0A078AFA2_STYLE|nr:tubulin-tyrosine ligase family protein [Stylonychia lemnae]|eukprot:CDW80207.1 tubulin-tyrosine ligase family protein [Stylonychia lemnae]
MEQPKKKLSKAIPLDQSQQQQKPKAQIVLNTREVRYPVIKKIARQVFGWKISKCRNPEDDWDILWTDQVFSAEKLQGMKPYQMINHFPGMYLIALKHNLGKYLKLMQKAFPEEFKFFPRTWIAPYEFFDLNNFISTRKTPLTMIVKPQNQCQGKGIFITRKVDEIPKDKCQVVQQYQTNPYLINNKKFDLRIYVLVTQVEPTLNCFIYGDGLARFATDEYNSAPVNNSNLFMHLTNYAINKNSDKFAENEQDFKKRLVEIYDLFKEEGHNIEELKSTIKDMIIKTLMSIQPQLAHNYKSCTPSHAEFRSCFELLGFDILIDKKLKPWLLEVNHAPSFNDDTEVDKIVKTNLITDTFRLLDVSLQNKQRILNNEKKQVAKRSEQENPDDSVPNNQKNENNDFKKYENYQLKNLGNYEKIYPLNLQTEEAQIKNAIYEQIREEAHKVWVSQTGVKKSEENKKKQVQDMKDMKVIMKNRLAKSSQDSFQKDQPKRGESKVKPQLSKVKSQLSQNMHQSVNSAINKNINSSEQDYSNYTQQSTKPSVSSSQSQRMQVSIVQQQFQMYEPEVKMLKPPINRGQSQKSNLKQQPIFQQQQTFEIQSQMPLQPIIKEDPPVEKRYYIDTSKYDWILPDIKGQNFYKAPKQTGPKQALQNQVYEFSMPFGDLGKAQQEPSKKVGQENRKTFNADNKKQIQINKKTTSITQKSFQNNDKFLYM